MPDPPPFRTALLAGGLAGTTVDMALFPLDTLKTRLQSAEGFLAAGGFRGIYRGIGSALVGSAPGAAFFFVTYESTKSMLAAARASTSGAGTSTARRGEEANNPLDHMLAASLGEIAACAVRVPTEVIKQRAQAGQAGGSSLGALLAILRSSHKGSVFRELYRGWGITVLREVPFTVLQFPLWEGLKSWGRARRERTGRGLLGEVYISRGAGATTSGSGPRTSEVGAGESALYGSLAGAVAAAATTPLDVLKTRVMLAARRESVIGVARQILRQHGIRPFFAGIGPRVMWISIGGGIFLGSYQWAVNALEGGRVI